MRASRLLSLVLLLQVRGHLSAEEIAQRLEVSVRTVYRDVQALNEAGVPIIAERGPYGGYRLRDGYRTKLTGLTPDEAEALFLAGVPGPAAELGLGSLVAAAQLKVLASLPTELRERAERVARIFHLDAPAWFRRAEQTPFLTDLAAAVWEERRIDIDYRRRGEVVHRRLDPLGLVLKAGAWYLVGRIEDDLRVYRASRIARLELLDERFEPPDGFDLAGFWAVRTQEFEAGLPSVDVTLRVRAEALHVLRMQVEPPAKPLVPREGEGWLELTLPFERLEFAYTELMPLGSAVEVLAPDDLRQRIAATGREVAALYSQGAETIAITSNQT